MWAAKAGKILTLVVMTIYILAAIGVFIFANIGWGFTWNDISENLSIPLYAALLFVPYLAYYVVYARLHRKSKQNMPLAKPEAYLYFGLAAAILLFGISKAAFALINQISAQAMVFIAASGIVALTFPILVMIAVWQNRKLRNAPLDLLA